MSHQIFLLGSNRNILIIFLIYITKKWLKISTGRSLTACLLTKHRGVELEPPNTNSSSGREEDLSPGPLNLSPLTQIRLLAFLINAP